MCEVKLFITLFHLLQVKWEGQNDSKPLYYTLFRKISRHFLTYALIPLATCNVCTSTWNYLHLIHSRLNPPHLQPIYLYIILFGLLNWYGGYYVTICDQWPVQRKRSKWAHKIWPSFLTLLHHNKRYII